MDKKILKSQEQIRSLRGKFHWTGALDAMRCDSVEQPVERVIEDERPEIADPPRGPVDFDSE